MHPSNSFKCLWDANIFSFVKLGYKWSHSNGSSEPLRRVSWCHDVLAGHRQAALLAAKEKKLKAMVATSFPSPPHLLFSFSPLCLLLLFLFLSLLFPLLVFLSSLPLLLLLLFSPPLFCCSIGRILLTLKAKADCTATLPFSRVSLLWTSRSPPTGLYENGHSVRNASRCQSNVADAALNRNSGCSVYPRHLCLGFCNGWLCLLKILHSSRAKRAPLQRCGLTHFIPWDGFPFNKLKQT